MIFSIRKQQGGSQRGQQTVRHLRNWLLRSLLILILGCSFALPLDETHAERVSAQTGNYVFLPSISNGLPPPIIHVPFFDVADIYRDRYNQMSVFWFGKVSPSENYTHVRLGYNQQLLSIEANIYDKELWYDERSPTSAEVANWDAASIYLHVPATPNLSSRLLRFDAQLSHWQDRLAYQAVFERTANGWTRVNVPFITKTIYRGEGINGPADDKGWIVNFEIPFASLGFSTMPASQSVWKMGVRVNDQDTGPGGSTLTQVWPTRFAENNQSTFGQISFGFPSRGTPSLPAAGSVTIKQGGGVRVPDGSVGGHATCGSGTNYWSEWGELVYDSGKQSEETVVQNQKDVSDFPCFSRYYVTFPLGTIPPGKVILSAKLTLHQFGNSYPAEAQPSFIQVFRVQERWAEETLSWNNSPQVFENYPGIWVDPLLSYPGVPGVARTWDVTQALIDSLQSATPQEMRLALQSADAAMHSGKYFWASETASWNATTPPTLTVQWANP